jgi:hypothetical protein
MARRTHPLLLATALLISIGCKTAAAPPDPAEPYMRKMVAAVAMNDYATFAADGTPRLRGIPRPLFTLMTSAYAPRLAKGFQVAYVGKTNVGVVPHSTWKLVPGDGGKEMLAKVNMVNGKVDSFMLE